MMKSILGALGSLALFSLFVRAQEEALAKFGDTVEILGKMQRTDQDWTDGFVIDLFSPTNRTMILTNNTSPLPGQFVTGSSGEGWVSLSKYSWIITMNETADDMIAKIEVPHDPQAVKEQGIEVANLYVGTLAADKRSWIVSEAQRNVHIVENKTRIIKMTSLAGEYMLLGRKSVDTSNIFVQYGQGPTRTVNLTGGPGVQEAEFVDGLRFNMAAAQPMTVNVDIPDGIDPAALPAGTKSINSFAWVMNSTTPAGNAFAANVVFPFNPKMLAGKVANPASPKMMVGRRAVNAPHTNGEKFAILPNQVMSQTTNGVIVSGLTAIDGQYVMLAA